ncbi:MAG: hypothetical protein VCD00_10400 [Candidatus Hydrogenedentota bacterium]
MLNGTDDCNTFTITHDDVTTPGGCPAELTITRTWTATDTCGNASSCVQTITVVDITPPIILNTPAGGDVACNTENCFTITATDDCDPDVDISIQASGDVGAANISIVDGTVCVTFNVSGTINFDIIATDDCGNASTDSFTLSAVCGGCTLLLIDEDAIDNGLPPNYFSDVDVNDQFAEIGVRDVLKYFAEHVGETIKLHSGTVGDEGFFALTQIPSSWDAAGPTSDGARNFRMAGPGLGSYDSNGDRESLLDKIPGVTPLRATGLKMLEGQTICAVVYDSDISINYDPLDGSLKGANLGIVAFEVLQVKRLRGHSSGSLPEVTIRILDASNVFQEVPELFTDAPQPTSSSEPYDTRP